MNTTIAMVNFDRIFNDQWIRLKSLRCYISRRRCRALLWLVLAATQLAIGQDSIINSLKSEVRLASTDSAKMMALYQLTYAFLNSSLDSAMIYANQCLQVAKKTDFKKMICNCNSVMATTHMYSSNYDSAKYYYDIALDAAIKFQQPDRISALYSNFGVLYKRQELYDKAAQSYIDGLIVDEENNNYYGIVIKKINLANLYSTISDDNRALQYGEEALLACDLLERADKDHLKSLILNNLGAILSEQGKFEQALVKFENALVISRGISNKNEIARNLHNIGSILEKLGRTEQGLPNLIEALTLRSEVGDKVGLIETHMQLGTSYAKLNDQPNSANQFEQALNLAEEINNHTILAELYLAMSSARKDRGDFQKALSYLEAYHAHADSIDAQYDRKAYLEMESKYQAARKDATIAQQELLITKQRANRNLFLWALLALVGGFAFLYYRYKKNKMLTKERINNLRREHKLAALDYVVEGQEKERQRIARDLHDGLGGLLSSIKMKIEGRTKDYQRDHEGLLAVAGEMIDEACTEVRRISHDMMPGALIQLGLVQAVEDMVEEVRNTGDVNIEIDYEGEWVLTDQQSVHLYRIIQEILNNSLKYSQASEIDIKLKSVSDQLQLIISDDGVGFDLKSAKRKGGIGLKNIEARVAYLDGNLKIITKEMEGCTYIIRVPLNK